MSDSTPSTPIEWADLNAVAKLMQIGRATAERLLSVGRLPRPTRLGRLRRWNLAEVRAWMSAGAPDRTAWEASKR